MNKEFKRLLVSSVITFFSVFLPLFGSSLGNVDQSTAVTASLILGLIGTASRLALKVVVEKMLLPK